MLYIGEATVTHLNFTTVESFQRWGLLGTFLRWFIGSEKTFYIKPIIGITLHGEYKNIQVNDLIVLSNGDKFFIDWKKNTHAIINMAERKRIYLLPGSPRDEIYNIPSGTQVAILGSMFKEGLES